MQYAWYRCPLSRQDISIWIAPNPQCLSPFPSPSGATYTASADALELEGDRQCPRWIRLNSNPSNFYIPLWPRDDFLKHKSVERSSASLCANRQFFSWRIDCILDAKCHHWRFMFNPLILKSSLAPPSLIYTSCNRPLPSWFPTTPALHSLYLHNLVFLRSGTSVFVRSSRVSVDEERRSVSFPF